MMKELTHEMKLLGLIMPEEDELCSYFKEGELPDHFVTCIDFRDIYKLKKGKRNDTKENLEANVGMDLVIHDQKAKKYFYRTLKSYTNLNTLFKYFEDGNLYILRDELRVKDDIVEVEEKPVVIEDKTELIF